MIELGAGGGQSLDKHLEAGDADFVMEHFVRDSHLLLSLGVATVG